MLVSVSATNDARRRLRNVVYDLEVPPHQVHHRRATASNDRPDQRIAFVGARILVELAGCADPGGAPTIGASVRIRPPLKLCSPTRTPLP